MAKAYDLKGKKFNRLTVIKKDGHKGKKVLWECICECGNITHVMTNDLTSGNTKSCGCLNKEKASAIHSTHKMSKTPLYKVWGGIKQRCYYEKHVAYERYGGRGIKMSEEWLKFENFYNDMKKGFQQGLTIDRKNSNGDYCKENCIWATYEQQANNKRNNRIETVNGITDTISNLAKLFKVNYSLAYSRIYRGWGIERALFEPKHKNKFK